MSYLPKLLTSFFKPTWPLKWLYQVSPIVFCLAITASFTTTSKANFYTCNSCGQIALSGAILSGVNQQINLKNNRIQGKGDVKEDNSRSLRIFWKDRYSRAYLQQTLEEAAQKHSPEYRRKVELFLKELEPTSRFRELTYQHGLNQFSLPDLFTMYIVSAWEIITGRQASQKNIYRLKDKIRKTMLDGSVFTQISNLKLQEKQFWMETLATGAIVSRHRYQQIKQGDNSQKMAQLRSEVQKMIQSIGLDLQKLGL